MMALDFAAEGFFFLPLSSLVLRMFLCEMPADGLFKLVGFRPAVFHACPAVADRIHIDDDAFAIVTIYQVNHEPSIDPLSP